MVGTFLRPWLLKTWTSKICKGIRFSRIQKRGWKQAYQRQKYWRSSSCFTLCCMQKMQGSTYFRWNRRGKQSYQEGSWKNIQIPHKGIEYQTASNIPCRLRSKICKWAWIIWWGTVQIHWNYWKGYGKRSDFRKRSYWSGSSCIIYRISSLRWEKNPERCCRSSWSYWSYHP